MKQHLTFLLRIYLLTIAVFAAAKLVFLAACRADRMLTLADVADVLVHGLSLDLSVALYFLVVPFLLVVASIWLAVPRWLCHAYYAFAALLLSLAFVADTSLYPFWGFKLDATCLQYLDTPTEAMASVSAGYLVLRLLAVAVVAALLFLAYRFLGGSPATASPRDGGSLLRRLGQSLLCVLLVPLFVIGMRGGIDESTTNVGQVYFSQTPFLNHSAVNPVFSFFSSFEKSANYVPTYQFMDETERVALMDGLYPTESVATDTLLRTTRPNVVIILLESCGGIFTEEIGHRSEVMPRLNQLVREGVYFAHFYANSYRTDRGTLCTWSGFPSFPRSSVMKMPSKTRFLPGIARSLQAVGYQTSYLYGGDINFTNMKGYLVTTGFERLHAMTDYSTDEQHTSEWGVRDDITFATLSQLIAHTTSPFLIGYSTLSSHEPWDVPTHRFDDEVLNAFNYLDECIGHFVDEVRRTPQWQDLLLVLLPDHGFSYGGVGEEHPEHDHVPMLWLGGAVKGPRRVEQLCNQTDLPATLLGQMGIAHADFRYSRDVMSQNYRYPFAVHTFNNGITMRDSTGFAVFDLNANRIIVDQSTNSELLISKGKAILQTAAKELRSFK